MSGNVIKIDIPIDEKGIPRPITDIILNGQSIPCIHHFFLQVSRGHPAEMSADFYLERFARAPWANKEKT